MARAPSWSRDVRVLGQSPELRDHLEKELSPGH
jgi:hypothetical protein